MYIILLFAIGCVLACSGKTEPLQPEELAAADLGEQDIALFAHDLTQKIILYLDVLERQGIQLRDSLFRPLLEVELGLAGLAAIGGLHRRAIVVVKGAGDGLRQVSDFDLVVPASAVLCEQL